MRRLEARDPPALLVDQHRRVGAPTVSRKRATSRRTWSGVSQLRPKRMKPERIGVAEERALVVGQSVVPAQPKMTAGTRLTA